MGSNSPKTVPMTSEYIVYLEVNEVYLGIVYRRIASVTIKSGNREIYVDQPGALTQLKLFKQHLSTSKKISQVILNC